MSRFSFMIFGFVSCALAGSLFLYSAEIGSEHPSPALGQMIEHPHEDQMDQSRSPLLAQSLSAFEAAGASAEFIALLEDIESSEGIDPRNLSPVDEAELSRVFSPVPTRHAGDRSSALVFALDAGNRGAMEGLVSAGADPLANGGLFANVAVRHYVGSLLDRDWSLSVYAINLYLRSGGDPTFAAEDANLPLFGMALMDGNLPGAIRLLDGGADIWAPTRRWGQRPGILAIMSYSPDVMTFLVTAAEAGRFQDAPPAALAEIIEFYADGYLDADRSAPDPSFPHSGTIGSPEGMNKADLVIRLFRAIERLVPRNPDLMLVLRLSGQ